MPAANTSEVVLGASSIEITRNPTASNTAELIPKIGITGVYPLKINTKQVNDTTWKYRFDTICQISIVTVEGNHLTLELQEITNQPTWSTGDLAGQQQAIADINAWL